MNTNARIRVLLKDLLVDYYENGSVLIDPFDDEQLDEVMQRFSRLLALASEQQLKEFIGNQAENADLFWDESDTEQGYDDLEELIHDTYFEGEGRTTLKVRRAILIKKVTLEVENDGKRMRWRPEGEEEWREL